MPNCENCIIIDSLNNAWRALADQWYNSPSEEIRHAMNLLAKLIGKLQTEFTQIKKDNEPKQLTIEEWLEFINAE